MAAAVGVASMATGSDSARDPGYADTPSDTPPSDPSPTTSAPRVPAMVEYDRARADVDGDGAADIVRVQLRGADAYETDEVQISKDVRLLVELAAGATQELRLGDQVVPTISATPDLDGNGTAEVLLSFTPGGDGGWLDVFTWDGDAMAPAPPAAGSPVDLVDGDSLTTVAELVGAEVVDGRLFSWVGTGDTSAPFELRVWTWQLGGQRLVATEVEGPQCRTRPGEYPEPC